MKISREILNDYDAVNDMLEDDEESFRRPNGWNKRKTVKRSFSKQRKRRQRERDDLIKKQKEESA